MKFQNLKSYWNKEINEIMKLKEMLKEKDELLKLKDDEITALKYKLD